jgi:hypothetical protein
MDEHTRVKLYLADSIYFVSTEKNTNLGMGGVKTLQQLLSQFLYRCSQVKSACSMLLRCIISLLFHFVSEYFFLNTMAA